MSSINTNVSCERAGSTSATALIRRASALLGAGALLFAGSFLGLSSQALADEVEDGAPAEEQALLHPAQWEPMYLLPGASGTVTPTDHEGANFSDDVSFGINTGVGVTKQMVEDGFGIDVDPTTGAATVTVPADAEPGRATARPYALYPDGSSHTTNLFVYVLLDTDGDGVPDADQPEAVVGYAGPVDACPADSSNLHTENGCPGQRVTHGVVLVDAQGEPILDSVWIESDGNRASDAELQVEYNGVTTDFSSISVAIGGIDAAASQTATQSAWMCAKGFSVCRNFGTHVFELGEYDVSVKEDIANWAVMKAYFYGDENKRSLVDGMKITFDGDLPNQFVVMGYDANDNNIADAEEQALLYPAQWEPMYLLPGASGTVTPTDHEGANFSDDVSFGINTGVGVTKQMVEDGFGIDVDPTTGAATVTVPADAEPGRATARPYALYPDGSSHTTNLFVYVLLDTDGDGVPDADQPEAVVGYTGAVDKCPAEAGPADNNGCLVPAPAPAPTSVDSSAAVAATPTLSRTGFGISVYAALAVGCVLAGAAVVSISRARHARNA